MQATQDHQDLPPTFLVAGSDDGIARAIRLSQGINRPACRRTAHVWRNGAWIALHSNGAIAQWPSVSGHGCSTAAFYSE